MPSLQSENGTFSERKSGAFLNRPLRLIIIFGALILFAFLFVSAEHSRRNMSNRVIDWLPAGIEETDVFLDYYSHFPEGELLMLSWRDCDLDDPRLDLAAERLAKPPKAGETAYFERVLSTRSLFRELAGEPLELRSKQIAERLKGWLIGRNDRDACLVAMISSDRETERREAVEFAFQSIEEITGLSRNDIYIAGPTIDSVAIDEISEKTQKRLLPFFLLFCFILLLCCLRHFFAAAVVFITALMNEELGGALIYWTGSHADSISSLISSLVYVLTISAGVHLINYYRETLNESDVDDAPRLAIRKAARPCTLAVLTTVFGLVSLSVSRMIPIRNFGFFASAALLMGTAWLFLFLPSVLQQYPIRIWRRKALENPAKTFQYRLNLFWGGLGRFVQRFRTIISLTTLSMIVILACGIGNLRTTVSFHGMLPETSKVIRDYNTLESRIGGLIPIEVVLVVPDSMADGGRTNFLDQLYHVEAICSVLSETEEVDGVVSLLNFLPDLPSRTERTIGAASQRSLISSLLRRSQEQLKATRFFDRSIENAGGSQDALNQQGSFTKSGNPGDRSDGEGNAEKGYDGYGTTYWRISLRIPSRISKTYETLLVEIRDRLDSVAQNKSESNIPQARYIVTGGVPVVHRAQQLLLSDLIESFIMAFLLIAVTMIVMLRGLIRGLLAMIPNIFPCVVVFGFMGWMDWPINMGSMMTASVAMGIAVDGTLHFITWFQSGIRQGLDRSEAIVDAYRRCATALTQTTIICGLGILVFGLSDFVPVSQFAVLMAVLLAMSLIGDIIVFPAVLFGPLGKFFETKNIEE